MTDERKFKLLAALAAALSVLVIAYNISSEYFIKDLEGYLKRRLHYESTISKKGLSLYRAEYWSGGKATENDRSPKK